MATQEGGMWLYKAGVPRFSLVLWSKPFREGKLRLPKGFAKEHGAQLANEVLIKLPNGAEWQVSVVRGRKRIWFVKGWREFADFYSLKPTNYLVFGLVSRGRLNVIIFDTTATEIDYSNTKVNVKVEPDCDVTSNEAVQRPSPSSPKATVKPSLKPHKLRTKNVKGTTASGEEIDGNGNGKQGKQIKDEHRSCTPRRTKSAYWRTANERANVVFESENSRATESDFTCRPNKHGNSPKTRDKPSLGSPQPHKLRRTNGMDEIASSSKGPIRNKTPRGNTSSIPTEGADPLARAKAYFKSENPFFIVVMHSSYIGPGKRLHAQAKFFEKNFTDQCGAIVLQLPDDVRVWRVKYRVGNYGNIKQAVFQSGSWNSFANDNSLRVGDVCVFELVECCTEPRLNVTIFQASQDGHSHGNTGDSTPKKKDLHQKKKKAGDQRKKPLRPTMEAANAFTSNQPFFKTAVTTACLKRRQVSIPVPFWNHMKKSTRKMELRVGSQAWEVSVSKYEADLEKKRIERVYINGGWAKFAEGNSLVPGDVCVFELIKGEQEEDADADVDAAGLGMTVACVHVFRG